MGVNAESAVTPTVIVALSAHHALSPAVIDSDSKQSLQEEEERPRVAQAQDYLGSKQMLDYELDWTGLDCIALGIACSHHMPLPTVTPCLLFREQLPNVMPLP